MLGAVAGDIIGSPYRYSKAVNFPLMSRKSIPTGNSIMTLAVAMGLSDVMSAPDVIPSDEDFSEALSSSMRMLGRRNSWAKYEQGLYSWLLAKDPRPCYRTDNVPALRVSPLAWAFSDIDTVEHFAELSARITHDNTHAVKGARAMAGAVFLARTGRTKSEIREYITGKYHYDLSRTIHDIRPDYAMSTECIDTIPEAITAFLEGRNFEEAVRKAVSLGGDSCALASMSGAISEAMYGMSISLEVDMFIRLKGKLRFYVERWEQWRD